MWSPRVYLVKEGGALRECQQERESKDDRQTTRVKQMGNHQRLARLGQGSSCSLPVQKDIPRAKPAGKGRLGYGGNMGEALHTRELSRPSNESEDIHHCPC